MAWQVNDHCVVRLVTRDHTLRLTAAMLPVAQQCDVEALTPLAVALYGVPR